MVDNACAFQGNSALTIQAPNKIAADDTYFFLLFLSNEIRLDVSCESSTKQNSHEISSLIFSEKQ